MQHDLFNRAIAQIQRTKDTVAILFLHHALGLAKIEGPCDFLAHGKDMAVGIGLDAEQPQHPAHQ